MISTLPAPGDSPGARDPRWWALYTKARQEKAIARDLFVRRVPFYLPLVNKTLIYGRRCIPSSVPLFAGYVFLCGTEEERGIALATNRVSRVIPVGDPERLRKDLRQLARLIDAKVPLTVESRLEPGDHVRVKRGPFEGMEGTVLRRQGRTQLVVSVDFLKQGASVQIDDFLLEPL